MTDVLVIGSGASGVHYAMTALRDGHRVTLLDVGNERPQAPLPDASILQLKDELGDPVEYFLGPSVDRLVYPAPEAKHYGFPPSKDYVFAHPAAFSHSARGFAPTFSFARGGLAEAWTAGCYEMNDADFHDFPFTAAELQPCYAEVARRIGVSAVRDDIERFSPFTAPYLDGLPLDPHSARLLDRYASRRAAMNQGRRFYLGRSRVATLSRDHAGRAACTGLGRCLAGCPRHSLYTPAATLRECLASPAFAYLPRRYVSHFGYDARGLVTEVVTTEVGGGGDARHRADVVVLAAGTLGTARIYLSSLRRTEGRVVSLGGLMDNQHAVIPFVNTAHLGSDFSPESYQFHLLALGIESTTGRQEAHGQVTTLRAASFHPIVQSLPLDFRSGIATLRRIRSSLGVANVWRPAARQDANAVTLRTDASGRESLAIDCTARADDATALRGVIDLVRQSLRDLQCIAPPHMTQVLPLGSSIHYAGTLPMTRDAREHTCDEFGRVRGFANLVVADGASFPSLPAKNLTFTLMANAVRLAGALG